ncbi:MAG: hypothetical protein HC875_23210 [Anaerolineales bacterium]|nr:hypothetical protein [Anaerolineales bacterium]
MGLAGLGKLIQGDRSRPLPLNLSAVNFEVIIPLLLWAALNLALYLRWLMEVGSVSHTRLVFPALAAISLLLALGWHVFLPRRLTGWFNGIVLVVFLWLNLYSLGWLIYPAFRPNQPAGQPAATLDLTFLDSLKLVSGGVHSNSTPANLDSPPAAMQGDVILINAGWQTLAPPDKNYSVAAVLLAPDGRVLARRETYPGLGLRPTRYLQPGDSFVDTYPLKLEADVSEPLVARATVNLFDFDSDTRAGFPALDTSGSEVTPIVGEIKIVPKIWPEYQPTHAVEVNFAGAIVLTGYDFSPPAEGTGQGTLTLYWQSIEPVNADYVVFVHLLDERSEMLGQADGPPTGNAYPTRWWSPGETIADTRSLPSTPGLSKLRLGLYDLTSGQRLPITASSLPQKDHSVEVALP